MCDVFETATTQYADILLPASHPLERSDIAGIGGYAARGIVRSEKVFEAKGSSLSDFEIFRRLAAALGLETAFAEGLDEAGWQKRLYEEAASREKANGLTLPDWDAFVKTGIVFFPQTKAPPTALERFAADPEGAPLATESGRIMLASKRVAEASIDDCPGYPAYLGEPSAPGEYRLVSPKSSWRLHSQLDAVTRGAHNANGCEPCWINEGDAESLGISTATRCGSRRREGRCARPRSSPTGCDRRARPPPRRLGRDDGDGRARRRGSGASLPARRRQRARAGRADLGLEPRQQCGRLRREA